VIFKVSQDFRTFPSIHETVNSVFTACLLSGYE